MIKNPTVGMKCKLNDSGMKQIGGIGSIAEFYESQDMTITGVGPNLCYDHNPAYAIRVDKALIDKFIITNHEVDEL